MRIPMKTMNLTHLDDESLDRWIVRLEVHLNSIKDQSAKLEIEKRNLEDELSILNNERYNRAQD